ncbi:hypothetical protein BP6252_00535 [Coleophoma cylindrospora]|uniref:PAC domain-containing protein n=1 Tax=Coleophoma cylindrospora TaxID=1849047 RepID=A0A3D8SQA6_9HELO|nr:hypothetical protein BP6252_00535 [Coleophoma cylindrospora]
MEPNSATSSPTIRDLRLSLDLKYQPTNLDDLTQTMEEAFGSKSSLLVTQENDSDEGAFFDLNPPAPDANFINIEQLVARLFSAEHLHFILSDHSLFHRFSAFLNRYRPYLVPTLVRYLEMRKVHKALEYANAVARKIRWPSQSDHYKFSGIGVASTDIRFDDFAKKELLLLVSEAVPAFCTYTLIDTVVDCVARDITGQGIPVFRELVGELAEVFCLTDPSLHDNPIIYASEGPGTDKNTTLRLAQAIARGEESHEMLLNYRRDGTPFVNLLMCAPLYDDKGAIRYFIGAQVDVTGLVEEGRGIESFRMLLQNDEQPKLDTEQPQKLNGSNKAAYFNARAQQSLSKLQELGMMFSQEESEIVCKNSRCADDASSISNGVAPSVKNRKQGKRTIGSEQPLDPGNGFAQLVVGNGPRSTSLPGVYRHYLLVRPFPSLQIIFVSPSLRLPGILRTHLFSKLGGPTQTMSALENALRDGASVTAKVLWLPKKSQAGDRGRGPAEVKPRYIRCTPLLGSDDRVGVWMVILVPIDGNDGNRFRGLDMVDDLAAESKRFGMYSRAESRTRAPSVNSKTRSVNGDYDEGQGLRKKPSSATVPRVGAKFEVDSEADDNKLLYAEYMRSSSLAGE